MAALSLPVDQLGGYRGRRRAPRPSRPLGPWRQLRRDVASLARFEVLLAGVAFAGVLAFAGTASAAVR